MHGISGPTVRQDYRSAVDGFLDLLPRIGAEDWTRPALGVWSVRELVGHTSRALHTVAAYLDPDQRIAAPDLLDALAYFGAAAAALADPAAVADRGRQAGAALGDSPARAVTDLAHRVLPLVARSSDDALVTTPAGTMTLVDYLPTRTFELVVHTLDLAAATGAEPPPQLMAPAAGCLHLAAALAATRPDAPAVLLALTGRRALTAGYSVL